MRDITSANKAPAIHADRHAKGGADQITPERIGAAPGGYGIGETPKYIADANDAVKNGRYAVDKSTLNLPGPIGDLWHYTCLDVYTGNRPDVYIKQTMTSPYQSWHQCEVTRCFYDSRGGWQPWEWVNPPMLLDTEYRTTERYLGKPVYCKVVDFGAVPPANTKKRIGFGGGNGSVDYIISWVGNVSVVDNSFVLPYDEVGNRNDTQIRAYMTLDGLSLFTESDWFADNKATAKYTVWYTKKAD